VSESITFINPTEYTDAEKSAIVAKEAAKGKHVISWGKGMYITGQDNIALLNILRDAALKLIASIRNRDVIQAKRELDEQFFAAGGMTYSVADLAGAESAVCESLAKLEALL
jgi:hypothetical protein